jgi:hypothetical protein
VTKIGSNFNFNRVTVFVPEWPNGEFVGFYYWINYVDKKVTILRHKLLRRLSEKS